MIMEFKSHDLPSAMENQVVILRTGWPVVYLSFESRRRLPDVSTQVVRQKVNSPFFCLFLLFRPFNGLDEAHPQ